MLTYEAVETNLIAVFRGTDEPEFLAQPILYPEATIAKTITGTIDWGDSITEEFSALTSRVTNSNGKVTEITELSPLVYFRGGDGSVLFWRWWEGGEDSFKKTAHIDSVGTTETVVYISFIPDSNNEFEESVEEATTTNTYYAVTETEATLKSWEETVVEKMARASTTTAEGMTNALTFNGEEFVIAVKTYSETIGTLTQQYKTTTTTKEVSVTLTGNEFIGTRTLATGNTILGTKFQQDSIYTQTSWNENTKTVSIFLTPIKTYNTTEYGEYPFGEKGILTTEGETNLFYITNGELGTTVTFDKTKISEFPILATTTSNAVNANVAVPFNGVPFLESGTIVTTTESFYTSITTEETTEIGLTTTETSTTQVKISTSFFGPASTTTFSTIENPPTVKIESFISEDRVDAGTNIRFEDNQRFGFSIETTGTVDNIEGWEGVVHHLTLSKTAQSVFEVPQTGFSKAESPLQTTKINVLTFGIVDGNFTSSPVTSKTLYFAPYIPNVYSPIWAETGLLFEQTIETHWVREFRNNVNRQIDDGTYTPPFPPREDAIPILPALLFGNMGEAFVPQGVYKTYAPFDLDGGLTFVAGNSVLANPNNSVTAWRNLEYYTTADITPANSLFVATTSSFTRNNLSDQPIDDQD